MEARGTVPTRKLPRISLSSSPTSVRKLWWSKLVLSSLVLVRASSDHSHLVAVLLAAVSRGVDSVEGAACFWALQWLPSVGFLETALLIASRQPTTSQPKDRVSFVWPAVIPADYALDRWVRSIDSRLRLSALPKNVGAWDAERSGNKAR